MPETVLVKYRPNIFIFFTWKLPQSINNYSFFVCKKKKQTDTDMLIITFINIKHWNYKYFCEFVIIFWNNDKQPIEVEFTMPSNGSWNASLSLRDFFFLKYMVSKVNQKKNEELNLI